MRQSGARGVWLLGRCRRRELAKRLIVPARLLLFMRMERRVSKLPGVLGTVCQYSRYE